MYLGRSPSGERGLKFLDPIAQMMQTRSLPIRGAWIEICVRLLFCLVFGSLPIRGAWIEICQYVQVFV